MTKTAMIRARIEPELKAEVEAILADLGLTATEALTLFYQQIRLRQGLPFEVRRPNAVTRRTFEATDAGRELNTYESVDELFTALDQVANAPD